VSAYPLSLAKLIREQIIPTGNGKRLVLIIPCLPHPTDGASVVLYYWYAYALRHAGYQIVNLLILNNDKEVQGVTEYSQSIREADDFQIKFIICNNPVITTKWKGPQRVNDYLVQQVAKVIDDHAPEVLVCFDFISAWATTQCKSKTRLTWLGDLNFQSYFYHGVYALERREFRNAIVWFLRSYQWKKCYVAALRDQNKIIVSSGSSESHIKKLGLSARYLPYPWPVEDALPRSPGQIPTLAFFGTLGALGSLSSFRVLTNEIYPRLLDKYGKGNFIIRIFGRGELPETTAKIINTHKEFKVLGFVPDLRATLAECHAMIAPVEAPVGNRSRILTGLALNIPVIAHINTSLGNPDLKSGINCFLGNTAEEMSMHFFNLVDSLEYGNSIAEAGRKLYFEKFHPLIACKLLLREISEL
jgi:hypothetical protein